MKAVNQDVYVLGSARVPFVKSQTTYAQVTRQELMTAALKGLVERCHLDGVLIGETAFGAVMNSAGDFNLTRECVLSTTLHPDSPAVNIQRACGTGLETTWHVAMKIFTGSIELGISGGVDTNSDLPIEVSKELQQFLLAANQAKTWSDKAALLKRINLALLKPKLPSVDEPRTHLSMGGHCELMVKEWQITREAQDELAMQSHHKAAKALNDGFFSDLLIPYLGLKKDGILRGDTSLEKLSRLKPAFDKKAGSLTAGNSTALTDGAACVLVGSAQGAKKVGAEPLAKLIDFAAAGVDFPHGKGLLMAPTKAVADLLQRNKLTFADIDFFEIHEAFAGQVLCNLKAWESEKYCREVLKLDKALGPIDREKMNIHGSSLALGHPFATTGARIVGTLAKILKQNPGKRGLISICTAGGMGVAAILESV